MDIEILHPPFNRIGATLDVEVMADDDRQVRWNRRPDLLIDIVNRKRIESFLVSVRASVIGSGCLSGIR